jgi:carboxymethylenebutenolidase
VPPIGGTLVAMHYDRLLATVAVFGLACNTGPSSSSTMGPAPSASTTSHDARPELVTFTSGARVLRGYLHRPAGSGPFPTIVFNHGSEADPGTKTGQAAFYVPRAFALFVPHRRGQGQSKDAGTDINATVDDPNAFVDALVAQTDDVMAAVAYVRGLPFVDPARVAVAGCSLGGI